MEKYSIQRGKILGHILRHESLLNKIIEGDVEGNIAKGRTRAEHVKQIMQDTNKGNYKYLKEFSYDREAWKQTNLRIYNEKKKKLVLLHFVCSIIFVHYYNIILK